MLTLTEHILQLWAQSSSQCQNIPKESRSDSEQCRIQSSWSPVSYRFSFSRKNEKKYLNIPVIIFHCLHMRPGHTTFRPARHFAFFTESSWSKVALHRLQPSVKLWSEFMMREFYALIMLWWWLTHKHNSCLFMHRMPLCLRTMDFRGIGEIVQGWVFKILRDNVLGFVDKIWEVNKICQILFTPTTKSYFT